jgi:hypothetical protein
MSVFSRINLIPLVIAVVIHLVGYQIIAALFGA